MTHKEVFKEFANYFPDYAKNSEVWFPTGKNTIRVRLKDKREFIFQYEGMNNMRFETVKRYLKGEGVKNE